MVRTLQRVPRRVLAAAAVAALSLGVTNGAAQTGCVPEDFTAWAVNRGESALFLASAVDIHLVRWSTEREKDRFARTLLNHGPAAVLQAFRDSAPVGAIRTPMTFPYDLLFAWQEPLVDGGRRIVLITDRAMVVWKEAMAVEGTEDAFTVIEIRLTADGDGEGKVAIGSNITVNRTLDLIELRDYDADPVRLTAVQSKRATS
jgi:hypothetical protein